MSDFEPGYQQKDLTMTHVEPEVEVYFTNQEREAIGLADLFSADHGDTLGDYDIICISRGLNPLTQEPWTDDEMAEFHEKAGFDPRDPIAWMELDEEIAEQFNQYFDKRREQ